MIQKELQDKLAEKLLAGEILDGAAVPVTVGDGALVVGARGAGAGGGGGALTARGCRRKAARPPGQDGGRITPSTTWMMPFEAITSGCTTLTPPTLRPLKPSTMMLRPLSGDERGGLVDQRRGGVAAGHHVQLQDARELVAVLRHEQPLELALGQLREGGVARREDGERPRRRRATARWRWPAPGPASRSWRWS